LAGLMARRGAAREVIVAALGAMAGPDSPLSRAALEAIADQQIAFESSERGDRAVAIERQERTREIRARFRLMTDREVENLQPCGWLIEGLFFVSTLIVLFGRPNVAKSFLALSWALSIATGRDWLGRKVQQGPVVYVVAEGLAGFRVRLLGWKKSHGVDVVPDIRFVGDAVRMMDDLDVDIFLGVLKEMSPRPVLVILDTLSRCLVGGDENSSKDMGRLINAADRIRKELGAAVMLVHHPGKQGRGERGHGNLRGAADTMAELTDTGIDERILRSEKQKDAQAFLPVGLRLVPIQLGENESTLLFELDASARVGPVVPESDARILSTLAAKGGYALSGLLRRESGVPPNTFYKAAKRLLERGAIQRSGTGQNTRYRLVNGENTATAVSLPHSPGSVDSPTASAPPSLEGAGAVSAGSRGLEQFSDQRSGVAVDPIVEPPSRSAGRKRPSKRRTANAHAEASSQSPHEG
jgi:hypothetical protein